jgi:hypothetical protein
MVEELRMDMSRNYAKLIQTNDLQEQFTSQKTYVEMMHQENMEKFE